jgi:hypothetical protein
MEAKIILHQPNVLHQHDVHLCRDFLSANPDLTFNFISLHSRIRSSLLQKQERQPLQPLNSSKLAEEAIFFASKNFLISNEQILNYPAAAHEVFWIARQNGDLPLLVFDKPNKNGCFTAREAVMRWIETYCGYSRTGLSMLCQTHKVVRNILERLCRFPSYQLLHQKDYKYVVKCSCLAMSILSPGNPLTFMETPLIEAFQIYQQSRDLYRFCNNHNLVRPVFHQISSLMTADKDIVRTVSNPVFHLVPHGKKMEYALPLSYINRELEWILKELPTQIQKHLTHDALYEILATDENSIRNQENKSLVFY